MTDRYIRKDRRIELDQELVSWFNFLGWCNSLLDPVDLSYLKSKGVTGFYLIIFTLFFHPLYKIRSYGFNGVPFPFIFLKKKNKHRKDIVRTNKVSKKKHKKEKKQVVTQNSSSKVAEKVSKVVKGSVVYPVKMVKNRHNNPSSIARSKNRVANFVTILNKNCLKNKVSKDDKHFCYLLYAMVRGIKFGDSSFINGFTFTVNFLATNHLGNLWNGSYANFAAYLAKRRVKKEIVDLICIKFSFYCRDFDSILFMKHYSASFAK
jgi:hypothetical protein